jgi:hypothetical protein
MDYNYASRMLALDLSARENVNSTLFAINTTMSTNSKGSPILVLTTLYASAVNNSCIATLIVNACSIEDATIEYPVVIQNTTVMLDMFDKEDLHNETVVSKYVSPGNFPTSAKGQDAGLLQGLNHHIGSNIAQNVTLVIDRARNLSLYNGGLIAGLFLLLEPSNYD